jgi:hypothetical protein
MMEGPAAKGSGRKTIMIGTTYLKAHRTASSLRANGPASRTPAHPRQYGRDREMQGARMGQ